MRSDDLFWAKVQKTEGCWLWTGARNPLGYGILRRSTGGNGKNFLAHRYSLSLEGVEIGVLHVDHICHVPACVRPSHLRVVTNKQNHEHLLGANANSASGVRGVRWESARSCWRAEVKHNYKSHTKRFDDFDAACAYVIELRNQLFTHNDADRIAS